MEINIEITVTESAGAFKRSKSVTVSVPAFLIDMEADDGGEDDGGEGE